MARFTDSEIERYSRQMVLAEVGARGQEAWRAGHAVAADAVEARYLTAAGVGDVRLGADPAVVDVAASALRALHTLLDLLRVGTPS